MNWKIVFFITNKPAKWCDFIHSGKDIPGGWTVVKKI